MDGLGGTLRQAGDYRARGEREPHRGWQRVYGRLAISATQFAGRPACRSISGTLGIGDYSDARGVNATGVTVGVSHTDGGTLLAVHAFRHTNTLGMVDLTPTSDDAHAEAINDAGQIAGWREGRAFRLTGTTFTDLGRRVWLRCQLRLRRSTTPARWPAT
jgi:probable HAF family extracellular repeat protein